MIKTLYQHIYLLFTFKHRGEGLHSSKEAGMFLAFLTSIIILPKLFLPVDMGGVSVLGFLFSFSVPFLILAFVSIEKANAVNLIILGLNVISLFILLIFGYQFLQTLSFLMFIWQIAMIYSIYKNFN